MASRSPDLEKATGMKNWDVLINIIAKSVLNLKEYIEKTPESFK